MDSVSPSDGPGLHLSSPKTSPPNVSAAQKSQPSSWVDAVQNRASKSKHVLQVEVVDGTSMVEIPDGLIQNSVPLWEDFLEGKFLDKAPHVGKIHVIVNKIWPLGNKTIRIDVFSVNESTVKFRITDAQTRHRILRRGMWNIADIPMIVSKWSPVLEEEKLEIKTVPMWITMKNVPLKMYSRDGLDFIASAVGKTIRLHPETELCSNLEEAKVFVEADMTKALPKVYRFKSKLGIDAEIEFVYPWLPSRCSECSKWGHLGEDCHVKPVNSVLTSTMATMEKDPLEFNPIDNQQILEVQKGSEGTENIRVEMAVSETPETVQVTKEGWTTVSPGRATRSSDQNQEIQSVVSPTRFAILTGEDAEDVVNQAELEAKAGEVIETNVHVAIQGKNEEGNETDNVEEGEIEHKQSLEDIADTMASATFSNCATLHLDTSDGNVIEKRHTLLGFSVSDEDTEVSSDDSDNGDGMVDLLTPSGQRLLRERPVKPSIKAMQMQQSSKGRGRGNRGRGNHGGRG